MQLAPAQLEWAWLWKAHFASDIEFDAADAEKVTYRVVPEAKVERLDQEESTGRLSAIVRLSAKVEWTRHDDETTLPFDVEIDVGGFFAWTSAARPDERLARLWLEYNAVYLLWPYLRSFIAAISGMSTAPALTIYTMSVPRMPELEDTDENALPEGSDQSATHQIAPPTDR